MKTKENSPANGANLRKYSPAETQGRGETQGVQASRLPSTPNNPQAGRPRDFSASRQDPKTPSQIWEPPIQQDQRE